MTDFHDEKKSAAENGSAQQFTSITNTNGDRIMKKDAAKPETRKPLQRDAASLKPYVSYGHELIELNGKRPAKRGWREAEPLTSDEAEYCFAVEKNVGVRLGEKDLVIDVDPRNFASGADELGRFLREFDVDVSAVVETGSGGKHIYLEKPCGLKVAGKLPGYSGIDVKSAGGFVVAAGSVHPETGRLYRWESNALCLVEEAPERLLSALAKTNQASSVSEAGEISCEQLEEMLSALDPYDYQEHDDWLHFMMACHHATAGLGKSEFVAWSVSDSAYADETENIEYRWDSLNAEKPGGRTSASLYRDLFKMGRGDLVPRSSALDDFKDDLLLSSLKLDLDKSGNAKNSFPNACEILRHDVLKPAYDDYSDRVFFLCDDLPWRGSSKLPVDDNMLLLARNYLVAQYNLDFGNDKIYDAIRSVALENRFNPVHQYLDGLIWDKTPRLDSFMTRYFGVEDNEYAKAVGRLLLVAMVKRAREPGCKFDQLIVLEGKQGVGKSTALSILGGEFFSDAALSSLSDKDTIVAMQGKWLFEWAEGVPLGKARLEEMKGFLSRRVDECRLPFGRLLSSMPRRTVFVATTNDSSYLNDMTGLRRFLPISVGEIDLKGLRRDRDQLFAEADKAEASGESIFLPEKLWAVAAEHQNERLAIDPWCDSVSNYLAEFGDDVTRLSSSELLSSALGLVSGRQAQREQKRLVGVMKHLGWRYNRSVRIDGQAPQTGFISPKDPLF
jgi:hypothetical protein